MLRWIWLCLLWLPVACATVDDVKTPTVSLIDMAMGRSGLLSQELILTLRVGNPNDFAVPLEGLALKIDVNDRELADGLSDDTVTLPRLGYTDVEVMATASTLGLIRELIALGTGDRIDYRISGTAYVGTPFGRRAVPYDQTGSFSILAPSPLERRPSGPGSGPKIFKTI